MFENRPKKRLFGIGLTAVLVVLVAVGLWKTGLWKTSGRPARDRVAVVRRCEAVMGTSCTLAAVVPTRRPAEGRAEARAVLGEVESAIRAIEGRMSSWIDASEISRLNAAPMGRKVALSPTVLTVLGAARDAAEATDGAFDVTCRPLIELWREAGQCGILPDAAQRKAARALSRWELMTLLPDGVVKQSDTVGVDLGGIAKGYAIDRAVDILRRAELSGGLVDIGGDLACFGEPAEGQFWSVDLQDPFAAEPLATLQLREGAVCTSGNYERFTEIDGRRYSHILDPRTGLPADAVPSVTVVAKTAMVADVWATALSVLGPAGLQRLPEGVEALMVTGDRHEERILATPGLLKLLKRPLAKRLERLVEVGG